MAASHRPQPAPPPAPQASPTSPEVRLLFDSLTSEHESTPFLDRLERVRLFRASAAPEAGCHLDYLLAQEVHRLRMGLSQAQHHQEQLRALFDKLTSPPLHPAVFLGWQTTESWGRTALVSHGSARLVVQVADDVDPDALEVGDEVLLSGELNAVVGMSPYHVVHSGETASFERYLAGHGAGHGNSNGSGNGDGCGRAVVRWRDEELVVNLGGRLRDVALRSGDAVRWDRVTMVAFEKIERSRGDGLFLEETPRETFAAIGGLDAQIGELKEIILLPFQHAEEARAFHLEPPRGVILCGPPGTGKTMLARATANWLASLPGAGRSRFMHVKPGSLLTKWYGESEQNFREVFRVARAAAAENPGIPVVVFFDEVDSIGASRGESHMRVDDRVLNAFMAELDGFDRRGDVLVIAATNRRDVLDPAIDRGGRLGDLVIEVPRPNMESARGILGKHLLPGIPYAAVGRGGEAQAAAREELIETAVSRLYAPNGDSEVARLTFRDGKQRVVMARDLASGASLAKIARTAIRRACRRAVETGVRGVRADDVLAAIAGQIESAAGVLTPASCRRYLGDLPHDVDVVQVEPIRRKAAARAYRYLKVA